MGNKTDLNSSLSVFNDKKKIHLLARLIKMGQQFNIVYRNATNSFITMWFANSPGSLALLELKCFQLNSK